MVERYVFLLRQWQTPCPPPEAIAPSKGVARLGGQFTCPGYVEREAVQSAVRDSRIGDGIVAALGAGDINRSDPFTWMVRIGLENLRYRDTVNAEYTCRCCLLSS